jgi:hypothetical protein
MEDGELISLIRDIINNELNKKGLFEMSISKSDAIKKFNNMSDEIVEHIFKLFIYQNSPNYNKWKNEIATFVLQSGSYTIKTGNGKLSQGDYYDSMFQFIETDVDIENKYRVIVSKFKLNAIRRDIKNIEEPMPYNYFIKYIGDILSIIKDISVYLSENKNIRDSDIILILNKRLPKFE